MAAVPWYAGLPNMDADYARYMATEWGRSARRAESHLRQAPLLLGCTRALAEFTHFVKYIVYVTRRAA